MDSPLTTAARLTLPEGPARHLVQVLRLKPGEMFIVFNGHGGEYEATLESVGKREAVARIGAFLDVNRESPLAITLAQCVSKGDRMDYTLQKAVELGVSEVVPLLSSRSVVKLDSDRWEKKLEHWRGVILSACEQSGRTRVPALHAATSIADWLTRATSDLQLVLAPTATQSLRTLCRPVGKASLLIGPEGGLSEAEIQLALQHHHTAVALGPRVLRTETAGVAALSAIQALWGDFT
jgi:16S rRNA (uracil1498-N3)-methyltransferase